MRLYAITCFKWGFLLDLVTCESLLSMSESRFFLKMMCSEDRPYAALNVRMNVSWEYAHENGVKSFVLTYLNNRVRVSVYASLLAR